MSKFTPGPWEVVRSPRTVKVGRKWETVDSWAVFPADDERAELPIHTGHILRQEDAAAIALLPEMVDCLRTVVESGWLDYVPCGPLAAHCKAILAKLD